MQCLRISSSIELDVMFFRNGNSCLWLMQELGSDKIHGDWFDSTAAKAIGGQKHGTLGVFVVNVRQTVCCYNVHLHKMSSRTVLARGVYITLVPLREEGKGEVEARSQGPSLAVAKTRLAHFGYFTMCYLSLIDLMSKRCC